MERIEDTVIIESLEIIDAEKNGTGSLDNEFPGDPGVVCK